MRSVYRYHPRPDRDQEIITALCELAHQKPEMDSENSFIVCVGAGTRGTTSESIASTAPCG